jgi:amidophosphoribosyltransferase
MQNEVDWCSDGSVDDALLSSMSPASMSLNERPDKPEEACGVFAVLAAGQPVANLTYFGLYALQHRGQESAGIAVFDGEAKVRMHKDMGLVSQVFDQSVLERLVGDLAIGHNRYSTTGSSRVCNAQPVLLMTRLGPLALAHNGNLVNAAELRQSLQEHTDHFNSTTDSELIAFAIQQQVNRGQDWDSAIRAAAGRCRGAFSLVIGTPEGLFARWCTAIWGSRPTLSGWSAVRPAVWTSSVPPLTMTCNPVN